MIKVLFVLLILVMVGGIIALRYRKQIQAAIYILRMFMKIRRTAGQSNRQIETKEPAAVNSPLIQCTGCKNWVTQNKAIKIGMKSFYCTHACMEKSFQANIKQQA